MLTKNEKNIVAEFGKMLSFCYHFVIIVIDNIFYDGCTGWCLFLSFFLAPKNDFLHPSKTCDHYALVFLQQILK